jgi:hypothetical protein
MRRTLRVENLFARFYRLPGIDERKGTFKEGINGIHAGLRVDLILQFGLFRFAAEIEVGN